MWRGGGGEGETAACSACPSKQPGSGSNAKRSGTYTLAVQRQRYQIDSVVRATKSILDPMQFKKMAMLFNQNSVIPIKTESRFISVLVIWRQAVIWTDRQKAKASGALTCMSFTQYVHPGWRKVFLADSVFLSRVSLDILGFVEDSYPYWLING